MATGGRGSGATTGGRGSGATRFGTPNPCLRRGRFHGSDLGVHDFSSESWHDLGDDTLTTSDSVVGGTDDYTWDQGRLLSYDRGTSSRSATSIPIVTTARIAWSSTFLTYASTAC